MTPEQREQEQDAIVRRYLDKAISTRVEPTAKALSTVPDGVRKNGHKEGRHLSPVLEFTTRAAEAEGTQAQHRLAVGSR